MKINCEFESQVLASKKIVNQSNGKEYYQLTLFDVNSGEAGQLFTTEDIYKNVVAGQSYMFGAIYDDKYNSFKIAGMRVLDE